MRSRINKLLLAVLLVSSSELGAAVDTKQLIELFQAGLTPEVIVQQARIEGLVRPLTTEDLLALRRAGLPAELVSQLATVSTSSGTVPPSAPALAQAVQARQEEPRDEASLLAQVQALYREGKLEQAGATAAEMVEQFPASWRTRAIAVVVALRIGNDDVAARELQALAAMSGSSPSVVERLRGQLAERRQLEVTKGELRQAISALDRRKAYRILEENRLSKEKRELLKFYVQLNDGEFFQASVSLGRAAPLIGVSAQGALERKLSELRARVEMRRVAASEARLGVRLGFLRSARRFPGYQLAQWDQEVGEWLALTDELYRTNRLGESALSSLHPLWARGIRLKLKYTSELFSLTPLSCDVANLRFQDTLLTATYQEVRSVGLQVLQSCGSIRLMAEDHSAWEDLVIDVDARRLRGERSSNPLASRIAREPLDVFEKFIPFDLSFEQIKAISQRSGKWGKSKYSDSWFPKKAVVLELNPAGRIAIPALSHECAIIYGEAATREIFRNLARFVHEVVGRPSVRLELVDPDPQRKMGFFGALTAIGALTAAAAGDTLTSEKFINLGKEREAQIRGQLAEDERRAAAWRAENSTKAVIDIDELVSLELDELFRTIAR